MIRPTRTLATVLLAASLGVTSLGVSAASAADTPPAGGSCNAGNSSFPSSFLPTANPGRIVGISEGHVLVTNPNSGRQVTWVQIFGRVPGDSAHDIAGALNSAMNKAEERFDSKGKGDISDTADNRFFRVQKFSNGYGVVSTGGGVVAVYRSKKKANAVANALDAEAERQAERHGLNKAEPCVAPDFDPRSEGWPY